jgi:hypothetical protein
MADRNKLLVYSGPVDGLEDEYNDWYERIHLPEVLMVPGIVAAQRFKLHVAEGEPQPAQRYLAIYEFEGDPDVVGAALMAAASTFEMGRSIDLTNIVMHAAVAFGAYQTEK